MTRILQLILCFQCQQHASKSATIEPSLEEEAKALTQAMFHSAPASSSLPPAADPHARTGISQPLTDALDWVGVSIMSYSSFPGSVDQYGSYSQIFYPDSPMLHDIAAIQHLYGANNTHNQGDTIYSWAPGERLLETIEQRFLTFRRFRQKAVDNASGAHWVFDEDFDIRNHVRRTALPGQGVAR